MFPISNSQEEISVLAQLSQVVSWYGWGVGSDLIWGTPFRLKEYVWGHHSDSATHRQMIFPLSPKTRFTPKYSFTYPSLKRCKVLRF